MERASQAETAGVAIVKGGNVVRYGVVLGLDGAIIMYCKYMIYVNAKTMLHISAFLISSPSIQDMQLLVDLLINNCAAKRHFLPMLRRVTLHLLL